MDNSTPISATSGIYRWFNMDTGACYIGQAVNLIKRKYRHLNSLRKHEHYNQYLQSAWNKYSESAFLFVVIELCPTERLTEREQHWMEWCKERRIELYNMLPAAGSPLGATLSAETRARMSRKHTGKKASSETRARMSAAAKNRFTSPEACAIHAASLKSNKNRTGKKASPETRMKMSAAQRKRYRADEMPNPKNIKQLTLFDLEN